MNEIDNIFLDYLMLKIERLKIIAKVDKKEIERLAAWITHITKTWIEYRETEEKKGK